MPARLCSKAPSELTIRKPGAIMSNAARDHRLGGMRTHSPDTPQWMPPGWTYESESKINVRSS